MHRRTILALAALAAGAAAAQGGRPDPASPQSEAQPVGYRSAFEGYRAFAEEEVAPWRESNEVVKGGADGHAGHGDKPPAGEKPPAKAPAPHRADGEHK